MTATPRIYDDATKAKAGEAARRCLRTHRPEVGSRRYWEDWAKSVAEIAEAHITRISGLLDTNHDGVREAFDRFLDGLRANLNEGITRQYGRIHHARRTLRHTRPPPTYTPSTCPGHPSAPTRSSLSSAPHWPSTAYLLRSSVRNHRDGGCQ